MERGLLAQPAREAARAVARLRLERAIDKAAPFLVTKRADAAATVGNEEVHDFRVALRRLRSWIRATGDLLHADLPRRDRLALRRFARCAGAARDAQVEWQWLTAPGEPFTAPAARAAQWLAAQRLATYATERKHLQERSAKQWPALSAAIAGAFAPADSSKADESTETLGAHLAPVLAHHVSAARRALDRVEHRTQVTAIHRARIKVKRLRYLVEAVDLPTPALVRTLRFLRLLQDAFGDLHDAHVFAERFGPLLVPRRRGRRPSSGRPALRDLRALRAAVRRHELAAFRRGLDLLASPAAAAAWRVLERLPARLERPRARRVRRAAAKAAAMLKSNFGVNTAANTTNTATSATLSLSVRG